MKVSQSFSLRVFGLFLLIQMGAPFSARSEISREFYLDIPKTMGIRFHAYRNKLEIKGLERFEDNLKDEGYETVETIRNRILVEVNDKSYSVNPRAIVLSCAPQGSQPCEWKVSIQYRMDDGSVKVLQSWKMDHDHLDRTSEQVARPLTVTTLRQLTKNPSKISRLKDFLICDTSAKECAPTMDLHTHFGGAMSVDSVLRVAKNHRIPYPKTTLEKMGIHVGSLESIDPENVVLDADRLSRADRITLKNHLAINPYRVTTFKELEEIYSNRRPLVKYLPAFPDFLEELAKDYQAVGTTYVELSLADIATYEYLESAHQHLPRILEETGVHIVFKAALFRSSGPAYNDELMNKILRINSPYVVGVDFMGEETNSTRVFESLIRNAARYKKAQRPHFQIQVHAGESQIFALNMEHAIEAGATQIGHGIHGGMREKVLAKARENEVIIQGNISSNLALNNVEHPEMELKKAFHTYAESQIPITLGTDGHGLYWTDVSAEHSDAETWLAFTPRVFADMATTAASYMKKMRQAFKRELVAFTQAPDLASRFPMSSSGAESWLHQKKLIHKRNDDLKKEAESKNIPYFELSQQAHGDGKLELPQEFLGKRPISLIVPGNSNWLSLSLERQGELLGWVESLVSSLNSERFYLITSGTSLGGDALIYSTLEANPSLKILALTASEVLPGSLDPKSHAVTIAGETWKQRNHQVQSLVKNFGGSIIFLDGGLKAKDVFQDAWNNSSLNYLFYSQPNENQSQRNIFHYLSRFDENPARKDHLFANFDELKEKLSRIYGMDSIGERAEHSVFESSWIEFIQNFAQSTTSLPLYCKLPTVYSFIRDHYHYLDSYGEDIVSAMEMKAVEEGQVVPTSEEQEIIRFITENDQVSRPIPDYSVKPLSMESLWKDFGNELKYLDPRHLYSYFSKMTNREVLAYLKKKLDRGGNPTQVLGRLCVYLHRYSGAGSLVPVSEIRSIAKSPEYPRGLSQEERKQNLFTKLQYFQSFTTPEQLPEIQDLSREGQASGSHRGEGDLGLQPGVGPRRTEGWGTNPVPTFSHPGLQARVDQKFLILTRGLQGHNDLTIQLKLAFQNQGIWAHAFGMDANRANYLKSVFPEEPIWNVERDNALAMNAKVFEGLIAKNQPIIIYSDANVRLMYMDQYVEKAIQNGYQVILARASLLHNGRTHMLKMEASILGEGMWRASELPFLLGSGQEVQVVQVDGSTLIRAIEEKGIQGLEEIVIRK